MFQLRLPFLMLNLILLLAITGTALGTQVIPTPAEDAENASAIAPEIGNRLNELDIASKNQRRQLDGLNAQLSKSTDAEEKVALERQIKEVKERLARLRRAIEQLLIGGIDTAALTDQPSERIDWREELEMISLPLLASLRDLTAKPRRIEKLRAEIVNSEQKLKIIDPALASIETFEKADMSKSVQERISAIAGEWRARQTEVRQNLELARLQLANLSGKTTSIWVSIRQGFNEFIQGRGYTLVLASAVGIITWFLLRGLLMLYERITIPRRSRTRTTRLRVVEYAYHAITFVLVTIAVVAVFYMRNDLLLMALSIAAIIGILLGLRRMVPQFVREMRLLLDIGPVRENERVIVNGVPYKVVSLNVYSVFKNPRLDGVLRLPLSTLDGMTSRPYREEPWFPTKTGDYVLLSDGKLAQIASQSVEVVQLKVAGSIVMFASADFIGMGLRNISASGYGLAVTFGIDYGHQKISLDEPPQAFHNAVVSAIEESNLSAHLQEIEVEFKEAASNSLDYLILLKIDGSGAPAYFKLGRLVQQACVRLCNERNWTIPFNQLTLHPGDEFEKFGMPISATIAKAD